MALCLLAAAAFKIRLPLLLLLLSNTFNITSFSLCYILTWCSRGLKPLPPCPSLVWSSSSSSSSLHFPLACYYSSWCFLKICSHLSLLPFPLPPSPPLPRFPSLPLHIIIVFACLPRPFSGGENFLPSHKGSCSRRGLSFSRPIRSLPPSLPTSWCSIVNSFFSIN